MSAAAARITAVVALLLLAACAPVRVRETPETRARLAERERLLAPRTHWTIDAHIFVSDGGDNSGSGDLVWRNDGESYRFTLRAPTGRTWKLAGDAHGAVLEGVDPQPLRGADPQSLLRERLGWDVPFTDLASWVRGMRADSGPADVRYDEQGLPAVLVQDGWSIEYRDWFTQTQPPMPRKVFASRGKARVKLAIEKWSFDE